MQISRRWLWLALLALVTLLLFWRLWHVLAPFFLAAAFAYLLNPLVDRLETRHISRNRAILLILLLFLALGVIFASIFIPPMVKEINSVVQNYDSLVQQGTTIYQSSLEHLQTRFPWLAPHQGLPEQLKAKLTEYGRALLARAPVLLTKLVSSIASFTLVMLLTFILTFWMLREYHTMGRRLLAFVPARHAETAISLSKQINKLVSAYLVGQIILAVVAGIAAMIILLIFGVNYAVFIGLLAGALYLIPYFGVPSAIIISIIVSAVSGNSWGSIFGMIGCYVALNIALDYVISPRIIGNRVQLHPMTIIFAVVAVGELFGFAGVFIAVPLAAATKACLVTFFPEFFGPDGSNAEAGKEPGAEKVGKKKKGKERHG
jgi:predicted PurR-regulated permease PerM